MAKYEIRMNLIKMGQTLPLSADGYDPLADEKAHENVIKVSRSLLYADRQLRVRPDTDPANPN